MVQVGVYLPLYDYLMGHMDRLGWYAPLVAGASSRTAAVLCTSPLELLRTRAQVLSMAVPGLPRVTEMHIRMR